MVTEKKRDKGRFWQLLLVSLVFVFAAAMTATLIGAARRVSPVVDADYYARGLNYGKDEEKTRNAQRLGWRISASYAGELLEIRVHDRGGGPVKGGNVTLTLYDGKTGMSEARAEGNVPGITETSPGVYSVGLKTAGGKDLTGKVVFAKGDAVISERVVILY
ncbi:MAG: FixH family [Geobacteraceae bacterium]|nr:MAG: FixH family [Geobacteraceae bacterium]